jgi:surfeit locus 1 family protein
MSATAEAGRAPRSTRSLLLLGGAALLCLALLVGLGVWQLDRLQWKLHLIAQVNARVAAPPMALPVPVAWPSIGQENDEYRHVTGIGRFLNSDESLVEAVTDKGGGFWVMTPFRTDQGFVVLVNRGFVPTDRRDAASRAAGNPDGETTVTGLLRITEPGGGFLRSNDPAHGRWYSRDVAAIATAHGLSDVAPYFLDANGMPNPGGFPIGGLTVIDFANNHLVYALTWLLLALMLTATMAFVVRDELRLRRRHTFAAASADDRRATARATGGTDA